MKTVKFEIKALRERGGICLEHAGCSRKADYFYHDFIMMAYVAYGKGFHETANSGITEVLEGDILIVNPNVIHRFYPSDESEFMELYYCHFIPDMLGGFWEILKNDFPEDSDFFDKKVPYLFMKDSKNKDIRNLYVKMIDEFMYSPTGYAYMIKSYFTVMLTTFFRNHRNAINNPVFNKNKNIDEVIRYINYHVAFDISVHNIAEACHLSESYLCRLFKKHTGMTVIEFINNIKIEKAKDILKNTDRSIESIAEYMHCSTVHLKRIFKKHTGMTMNAFRNKYHYKS